MTEPSPSHAAAVREFRRRQDLAEARQRVDALAEELRAERARQEAAARLPSVQDRIHANPRYLTTF